jgi:hypothetical protein
MPNQQLVTLRDRARETDRLLTQAQTQQASAQDTLDRVRQKITDLGFDPDDDNLSAQVDGLLSNADVLLKEADGRLAKVREAMSVVA